MKTIIKVTLAATAFVMTVYYAQAYSPLRMAVIAFYATHQVVQDAVAFDVCKVQGDHLHKKARHQDDIMDTEFAGSKLPTLQRMSYDAVRALLGQAYKATNMTDGELEAVDDDFCTAINADD